MAIPTLIRHSHIVVALVTKLSFVCMAAHASSIQTHEVPFFVGRQIGRATISHDRFFPILQQILVMDADVILGLNALLLVSGELWFGDIFHFPARRIIPERKAGKSQEDDQSGNDLLTIIHGLSFLPF